VDCCRFSATSAQAHAAFETSDADDQSKAPFVIALTFLSVPLLISSDAIRYNAIPHAQILLYPSELMQISTSRKAGDARPIRLIRSARKPMRIRLTQKLALCLNGVDISNLRVGEEVDLPERSARILIADGWADLVLDLPPPSPKRARLA
jgi:hypothetical protein